MKDFFKSRAFRLAIIIGLIIAVGQIKQREKIDAQDAKSGNRAVIVSTTPL